MNKLIVMIGVLCLLSGSASAVLIGTFVEARQDGSNLSQPLDWDDESIDNWNFKHHHSVNQPTFPLIGGDEYFIMSYNARTGGDEQAPMITITETGLTEGPYDVYLVYYDSAGYSGWEPGSTIQAALSGQTLMTFDETTGTDTGYTNPAWTASHLREVFLGQTGVTTSIAVDVDDVSGLGADSMWEGISYVLVPEPVTLGFLAIGGLAVLSRRSR